MKRRIGLFFLAVAAVELLLLLVGPFFLHVPPLEGTLAPQSLANSDSLFIEIDGLSIHTKILGQGQPAFVLLHGFGASLYSWQSVMEPAQPDEYGQYL